MEPGRLIHWPEIEHHIASDSRRLCDGEPASESDVSSLDQNRIRQARGDATLCPDCQDHSGLPETIHLRIGPAVVRAPLHRTGEARLRCHPELRPLQEKCR